MSNKEKEKFKILVDKHKNKMPWYIIEYAEMKTALSPLHYMLTLLNMKSF